jgi:ferredoxin-NADP reductase
LLEGLFQPEFVQIVGTVILVVALGQALFSVTGILRRSHAQKEHLNDAREYLRSQTRAVLREAKRREDLFEHSWNGIRKFEVSRKVLEAEGVHSLYLTPHDGKPLPPFHPGQFLTFSLRIPNQSKPVIRCYSLSDSFGKDYFRVSVKKVPPPRDRPELAPGLSSSYLNDEVFEGDILDCKAPSGNFFLDLTRDRPVVLIGGGIGITPVLSMLNALCETGSRQEIWFFLGVRNSREHVQKSHLERLAAEFDNVKLNVCYSDPIPEDKPNVDYQHQGRVGLDLFKQVLPSNNFDFYICGPPPMMNAVTEGLAQWGVPEDDVHFEAFGPASVKKKPADENKQDGSAAAAFAVTFARSQKTVTWDGTEASLLDFAEANGIAMDSGCRAGNCGSCITALKSGNVEYLNEPGSMPETGSCLTCISIPQGDVTLDA